MNNFCHKRLLREYRDLKNSPLKNVSACPMDDDIQEWHINIVPFDESFQGCAFHLIMRFPDEYPQKAPKVEIQNFIEHPNVFGSYLCLDILTMSEETIGTPFRGWSSAYNVTSILTQLQSFLFDMESVSFSYRSHHIIRMKNAASSHICCCGHKGHHHNSYFPQVISDVYDAKPGVYKTVRKALLRELSVFHSKEVGTLPENTTIVVTKIKDNRCRVDLSSVDGITSSTGFAWCSYRTSRGLLLIPVENQNTEEPVVVQKSLLARLHDILLEELLQFLDDDTIHRISALTDEFKHVVKKAHFMKLRSYRCFYTMDTLQDDCIFGYGVNPKIMDKRSRKTGRKKACLQQLDTSFDCMTYEAFDVHRVRHNVWKDLEFNNFLPLYINNHHGLKSLPLAEKCILNMWRQTNPTRPFTPNMILDTLCKLMNTTVVSMMKSIETLEAGELKLHDSIKALEGYMSFHHLLLAFLHKYPSMADIADKKVSDFISNPLCRDKEVTPDLGELIIYISITKHEWKDVCPSFIEEGFQRNARWILAKYPNLNHREKHNTVSCLRLRQSWEATVVGKRLAMFQKFFLDEIANPAWLDDSCENKCLFLLNNYNKNYGRPGDNLAYKLQVHSRKVLSASCWDDYFKLIGFPTPSARLLCNWLRNSIVISEQRKYHSFGQILKYPQEFRCAHTCKLHMKSSNCMCAGGKIFSIKSKDDTTEAKPIEIESTSKNSLDLVFVIDCTGSMGEWLESCKKQIKAIIKEVKQTSSAEVRFGMVAYRDHCDDWTIKDCQFTDDVSTIQQQIDKLSVDGGGDYPEAVCCALAKATELSWNYDKKAMRVAVMIADAPPHGFCGRDRMDLDDHPKGCPCGHDSIRVCHTMKTKGITLYTVDCGDNDDAERQHLFHAMAGITGGIGLNLTNASSLSKVVVGACLEESSVIDLCSKIRPFYSKIALNSPQATEDQLVYMTYTECKNHKLKVKSCLPKRKFSYHEQDVIDSLIFCNDRQQAQAVIKQNYFDLMRTEKDIKLGEYEKDLDQETVRKCIQRIGDCIMEEKFLKDGCMYRGVHYKTVTFTQRRKEYGVRRSDVEKFWKELKTSDYKHWSNVLDKIPTRKERSVSSQSRVSLNICKSVKCWNPVPVRKNDPVRNNTVSIRNVPMRRNVPLRNVRVPVRNVGVPVRNVGVPVQNVSASLRNAGVPVRNVGVPVRNVGVSVRNVGVPARNVAASVRNAGVTVLPVRNVGVSRIAVVPVRNVAAAVPKRHVAPIRNVTVAPIRNTGVPVLRQPVYQRNVSVPLNNNNSSQQPQALNTSSTCLTTDSNCSTSSGSTVSKHPLTTKICTVFADTSVYMHCNNGEIIGNLKKRSLIKIDSVIYERAHLCYPTNGWIDINVIRLSKIRPTLVLRDIPSNISNQNSLFKHLQDQGWKTNNVKLIQQNNSWNNNSNIAFCEFKNHQSAECAYKTKIALGHVILSASWSSSYLEQRKLKLKYNL